jgi:hypothetical protein
VRGEGGFSQFFRHRGGDHHFFGLIFGLGEGNLNIDGRTYYFFLCFDIRRTSGLDNFIVEESSGKEGRQQRRDNAPAADTPA